MEDIDYFSECDLRDSNLQDFYDSLPRSLQAKFKASLHVKIDARNELQGYHGPAEMRDRTNVNSRTLEPSRGLQEIRFWWGFRVKGPDVDSTIENFFGRTRQLIVGESEWSSLYFDEETGDCLSHDRSEAARKLNSIGWRVYKQGKKALQDAKKLFNEVTKKEEF